MNQADDPADTVQATRVPADISRPDRILGPFTAQQTAVIAAAAVVLYAGYWAARPFMAPVAYVALVVPVAGAVAALALGRREGLGLDRFLLAALAHARAPKRRVHAPEGVPPLPAVVPGYWAEAAGPPPAALRMPYEGITAAGVLGLRGEGVAGLATCSTVNFELRSGAEQQGLTAAFARWLNSLTGPTQVLVRCYRVDLAPLADALQQEAAALPHPALERAAREHADFLADLAAGGNLLGRQVVLIAREESPAHGLRHGLHEERVLQRLDEATRTLAAAEITVTPLGAEQTADLVSAACDPDSPTLPGLGSEGGPA